MITKKMLAVSCLFLVLPVCAMRRGSLACASRLWGNKRLLGYRWCSNKTQKSGTPSIQDLAKKIEDLQGMQRDMKKGQDRIRTSLTILQFAVGGIIGLVWVK